MPPQKTILSEIYGICSSKLGISMANNLVTQSYGTHADTLT